MATEINATLAQVETLNNDNNPFAYSVENNQIVGKWKITDSRWFAPGSITDREEKYELRVTLNDDGTFKPTETKDESAFQVSINGVSASKSTFKGHSTQKSARFGIGGEKDGSNGIGVNSYSFDTSKIKDPLYTYLESQGWKKKGFFANLFG